ncbi:DUF1376 domain-containing protein [Salmonella enterica subsp. enterica serovar Bron]|nr:DUF1376 domain-containing protein [Salmonella enterica subsp. enterica serovar Bron]
MQSSPCGLRLLFSSAFVCLSEGVDQARNFPYVHLNFSADIQFFRINTRAVIDRNCKRIVMLIVSDRNFRSVRCCYEFVHFNSMVCRYFMAALPYMQLYIADYLADTMHLSTEEHGAYLLLMFNYWQTGRAIPKSRLAKIARLDNERWISVEESLSEFFIDNGEEWIHERIEQDLASVHAKLEQRSAAGKASVAKRKANKTMKVERESNVCSTLVESSLERNANVNSTNKDKNKDLKELKDPPKSPTGGDRNNFNPLSIELPEWLSPTLWAEWVGYRKQLGKPIKTLQEANGSINKLAAYRTQGHSPEFVVKLTMENEWRGLLVPEGTASKKRRDVNEISQPDNSIPTGFRG